MIKTLIENDTSINNLHLKNDIDEVKKLGDNSRSRKLLHIRKRLYEIQEITDENIQLFLEICTLDKSWKWKEDWISLDKIFQFTSENMMKSDEIDLYKT